MDAWRKWGLSKMLPHEGACSDGSRHEFVVVFTCCYPKLGEKHVSKATSEPALGELCTSPAMQASQDAVVPSEANRPETCDIRADSAGDCFAKGS